jgi:NAD(P)H-flavin reductase
LTFVIRLERNNLQFQTGQFVLLNIKGLIDQREYSIYSGENEEFIEVLVREINGGKISGRLKQLKEGQEIGVDGAFGFFRFDPIQFSSKKFLFVATGTGISPFHSFVKTYPDLNYSLVHGVRYGNEAYDHADFEKDKVVLCTTGDESGNYIGRVTDYLRDKTVDADTNCFLCGNSEMISELFDLLLEKGVPVSNIYTEVYF